MNSIFLLFFVGFSLAIGHAYGFKHGVESSHYDRVHANNKLQQCLQVIKGENL